MLFRSKAEANTPYVLGISSFALVVKDVPDFNNHEVMNKKTVLTLKLNEVNGSKTEMTYDVMSWKLIKKFEPYCKNNSILQYKFNLKRTGEGKKTDYELSPVLDGGATASSSTVTKAGNIIESNSDGTFLFTVPANNSNGTGCTLEEAGFQTYPSSKEASKATEKELDAVCEKNGLKKIAYCNVYIHKGDGNNTRFVGSDSITHELERGEIVRLPESDAKLIVNHNIGYYV